MSEAVLRIWPELPKIRIHPNVFGHMAEHLGRAVYEGIWVGKRSKAPHQEGLRLDTIAALKQLRTPVLRWPGGCFANTYHWRDGVGPVRKRPTRVNLFWKQIEPNHFGTDEFMQLCQAVGCAPYLTVNVASGTPREALNWLEYCNFGGDSALAQQRAAESNAAPYGVRYWGIGHEAWGCGGRMDAREYAAEYRRYAALLHEAHGGAQLTASGGNPLTQDPRMADWNVQFCESMRCPELIGSLSLHRYFSNGPGLNFETKDFGALFAGVEKFSREIEMTAGLLDYFYPKKNIGIAVDEWGVWHPEADPEAGLEQPNTLRDAIFAASVLHMFHRHADRVKLANLSQAVNSVHCLAQTHEDLLVLTPTYHVFDMMRPHMGAAVLTHDLDCEAYSAGSGRQKTEVPSLSTSVSTTGKRVLVTAANQTAEDTVELRIDFRGAKAGSVSGRNLVGDRPNAVNGPDDPKAVVMRRVKLEPVDGGLVIELPPHSCHALHFTLE